MVEARTMIFSHKLSIAPLTRFGHEKGGELENNEIYEDYQMQEPL